MNYVYIRDLRRDDEERVLEIIHEVSWTSSAEDYPVEIIVHLLDHQYNRDWFRDIVTKQNRFAVIDEDTKLIVAIGGLKQNEIVNMFVAPDAQRKGVGTFLLVFLQKLAEFRGYSEVYLNSTITAMEFYLDNSFIVESQNEEEILSHRIVSYRMKYSIINH